VDALPSAESLLQVVSVPLVESESFAAFSCAAPHRRLVERIEALLAEESESLHQPDL